MLYDDPDNPEAHPCCMCGQMTVLGFYPSGEPIERRSMCANCAGADGPDVAPQTQRSPQLRPEDVAADTPVGLLLTREMSEALGEDVSIGVTYFHEGHGSSEFWGVSIMERRTCEITASGMSDYGAEHTSTPGLAFISALQKFRTAQARYAAESAVITLTPDTDPHELAATEEPAT